MTSPTTNPRKPGFIRHFNWVAIILLVALLLLIVYWMMASPQLWPAQPFAEFVIAYPGPIRFFTAGVTALCALFFFWPREGRYLVGRWNDYVGFAFATFSVQYTLRGIELQLTGYVLPETLWYVHHSFNVVIYICSAANNLLFIGAARILLNKNKRVIEAQPSEEAQGLFTKLRFYVANAVNEFRIIMPTWTWFAVLAAPIALLDARPGFSWARFPDGFFSAYSLCLFGYATALNFNLRRRWLLATLALLFSLAYGAGQLVFALNPVIARTVEQQSSGTSFLSRGRERIGANVKGLIQNKNIEAVGADERLNMGRSDDIDKAEKFLDNAVFAALLPMKFLLFVPAFFLYLLSVISTNDFRRALIPTTSRRQDYLSSDGVVSVIGNSLGVDRMVLFIRLPGLQKLLDAEVERVIPITWERNAPPEPRKREPPYPLQNNELLVRVMQIDGEEIHITSESPEYKPYGLTTDGPSPHVLLLVPISFHGGVIGAFQAEFGGMGKFNHTTLQKLRLMADLVAPSVQDFRALAAVDQIGFRFTRLQVNNPRDNFVEATARMVRVLHDVLSPQATRLDVEIGFFSCTHIYPEQGECSAILEEQAGGFGVDDEEIVTVGDTMVVKSQTIFRPMEGDRRDSPNTQALGSLMMAIPVKKDKSSSPTLAAFYLNRRTVASLTSDGVFDAARNYLGKIIKELSVAFSKELLVPEEWFGAVADAARKSGLLWTVVTDDNGDEAQGEREAVEIVSGLGVKERAALRAQSPSSVALIPPRGSTHHVVRVHLPKTNQQLLFGIARPDFGPELIFDSPWKAFLLDLAELADKVFKEIIQNRQQTEGDKIKEAQYQGIITIAVTTGTLMHQLLNMIKDQVSATEDLEEELTYNGNGMNGRSAHFLKEMKKSAERLRQLALDFKSVTKMESHKPCSLRDAADQAARLFQISLKQRRIEFKNNISPEIEADVQYHVAAFALANLIGNAKDAIRSLGTIAVEAEEGDNFVLCHVTNTGPAEIPDDIRGKLFEFGETTKHGHNGWGLYFVKKALTENGGAISLDHSNSQSTRFTVRLPNRG